MALAALYVLSAGCRIAWVAALGDGSQESPTLSYPDEEAYWLSADSLAEGQGLIDEFGYRATYMPGYPAFLSLFAGTENPHAWARWIQALLGAWVAPATYLLARQWMLLRSEAGGDNNVCSILTAILAGMASAFDPFLIFFSGLFLTETLFAALLVSAWAVIARLCRPTQKAGLVNLTLAGILLTAMLLIRPAAAAVVLFVPVLVLMAHRLCGQAWGYAVTLVVLVILGLIPWAARNRQLTGEWVWLTTRGGISLYDGLQPGTTGESDLAHTKTDPAVSGLSEIQWDRHWKNKAWAYVQTEPARVLKTAGWKFVRTWSLTPNVAEHSRGATATVSLIWMIAALASALVGWLRARRPVMPWILLLAPVIVVTAQHMIFVGSVRYRVPVMPMVYVLSAYGLAGLWQRLGPQSPESRPTQES